MSCCGVRSLHSQHVSLFSTLCINCDLLKAILIISSIIYIYNFITYRQIGSIFSSGTDNASFSCCSLSPSSGSSGRRARRRSCQMDPAGFEAESIWKSQSEKPQSIPVHHSPLQSCQPFRPSTNACSGQKMSSMIHEVTVRYECWLASACKRLASFPRTSTWKTALLKLEPRIF